MPRPVLLLPVLAALPLAASGAAPLRTDLEPPRTLDLRQADPARLLGRDGRDPAQGEAVRSAWEALAEPLKGARAVRILLPEGPGRVPLLLAASQALKAQDPARLVLVALQAGPPILEESAWGAVDGGALLPGDLGTDPGRWREALGRAQATFPGQPWTLWVPSDPGPLLAQILGDGGRLVVPAGTEAARLAGLLPEGITDLEGGLGDLTLHTRGKAQRWTLQGGAWAPAELPRTRTEVQVLDREAYDVAGLLARMRAAQLRDRARIHSCLAAMALNLHFQGEEGSADLGFEFQSFERIGEPDELLRKKTLFNGVKANLGGSAQLPVVEARTSAAAPVALTLTERYRYEDGGPAGPGRRILRFRPVDKDPLLFEGELTVLEESGRIQEERSSRSNLPGIVRSETRTLTYGEPAPGLWRVVRTRTAERWMGSGGVNQVLRDIALSGFRINDPGFDKARDEARAGDGSILRETQDGFRYYVKQKDGTRAVETRARSGGKGMGGMLLFLPGMEPPVIPLAGFLFYDFNAFDRGIQYSFLTAGVFNMLNGVVPKAFLGCDLRGSTVVSLLGGTDRPVENGRQLDKDGVGHLSESAEVALGRDLGAGFRLELGGRFTWDRFSEAKEDKYRTAGFKLPPGGWTELATAQLTWQRKGFSFRGTYGEGRRPDGTYGAPGALAAVPDQGRLQRWDGAVVYDHALGRGFWINTTLGHAGGKAFDRFQSIEFDGRVSGIKPNALVADRMTYGGVNLVLPAAPGYRLTLGLDHGEAHSMTDQRTYGFSGLRIAGDLPGFWWFTTLRVDLGVGLQSDVKGLRTASGSIAFLHLF